MKKSLTRKFSVFSTAIAGVLFLLVPSRFMRKNCLQAPTE